MAHVAARAPHRDELALPVRAAVLGVGVELGRGREHVVRQLRVLRLAERAGGEVPAAGAGLALGSAPVVDALPPLVVAG